MNESTVNNNNKFKKNVNIVARKIHDAFFLIDTTDNYVNDTCALYQINETGFFIWESIEENRTCNDLADLLKTVIIGEVDYQVIVDDVIGFLVLLKKQGFVTEIV